jgi:hypothetical protein
MREPGSVIEHAAVDSAAAAHCAGVLLQPRPGLALGRRPLPWANWERCSSENFHFSLLVLGQACTPRICQQVGIGLASGRVVPIRLTQPLAGLLLVPVHTPPCPSTVSMFLPAHSLPVCLHALLYLSLAQGLHAEHSKDSRVACRLIDPLECTSDWRIGK